MKALSSAGRRSSYLLILTPFAVGFVVSPFSGLADAQGEAKMHEGKPVLEDPSGSEWGIDYFAQGGIVVDGVAYFLADQSCSKYWKGENFPFGVAFDVRTFKKVRTYPFKDTYDSSPLVVQRRDGRWLVLAHEYKEARTVAMDRDTAQVVWISPANQPGAYFFGHSYYVRRDRSKLILAPSQNGLHALDEETGKEVWWVTLHGTGGITPCVCQRNGWVFYQNDGKLVKIHASDGKVLKTVAVPHPNTCISWNTVLVNDAHGYFVATYWYSFVERDGKTRKLEWNSAIRVYNADLDLVWERTGLPAAKKSTLTYTDGKLVLGSGGHWGAKYEGNNWKYVAAYSIRNGGLVWKCDLSQYDFECIVNAPYAYGRVWAEAWGKASKMFRIKAETGALEGVLDYGVPVNSCAPFCIAHGKALSGDLVRDGVAVTQIARNSRADWPGPFCDPQTNTYALPDETQAKVLPMKEVYVGQLSGTAPPTRADRYPRAAGPALDLAKGARVVATQGLDDAESEVAHLVDGNPATYWHGSGEALTESPANIMILFPRPTTIAEVTIASQVFKERLRLKDFELYSRAGESWAGATPLAVVKNNREVQAVCTFEPVSTDALRLRIRDTWREDHAFPRVCEIEVRQPAKGTKGRRLSAAAIPDETEYERLLCEQAMGIKHTRPGTKFEPQKGYLFYAQRFVDTLLAKGTDIYGEAHSPMFVSILVLPDQKHPNHVLPCIPGQRAGDRAPFGGNLQHDIMLLQAMNLLSRITRNARYDDAAEAYLRYFLAHCPRSETGLFPWGEHAHWDFFKDQPGHTTHEYLGGIPVSFWERLWRLNSQAVLGEANGLINHIVDLDTFAWNRHADITKPLPDPRPAGLTLADFPRHGGFYILLWTFVHSKTKDAKYLDWSLRAIDHHWRLKKEPLNLPPFTVDSNHASMESALSLALSLLEAAALLPQGETRQRYEEVARTYLDAIARMPHKPLEGYFVGNCKPNAPPGEATGPTLPWNANYGGNFTADDAVLCCAAYRLTGNAAFLRLARECAQFYATHEPPSPEELVRTHVYAAVLTLFLDLHDLTHERAYLAQAKRYAELSIERLYFNGLFRGGTGINHYESQLMVGNLVYALVWLHVRDRRLKVKVEPNHFNR